MKKKYKWFLPLTLFAILLACENEFSLNSFKATKRDLKCEIERVRLWYDQNKPQSVLTRSGVEDDITIAMAPNWNETYLRENEEYETVEVAASMNMRITNMTRDVREKYYLTKNERYKQDMRRFVFLTDKKTNTMSSFVMLIIPDLIYMEKTDFKPFRENTYLERGKDFSGYILYYELDGRFANGWKYENGQLTRTVTETPYKHKGYISEQVITKSLDCNMVDVYQLVEECTDYYYYTEYSGGSTDWQYTHTTCKYYDEITGTYIECVNHDGNKDNNGGGHVPPVDPVDPGIGKYGTIYSNGSTLTDNEKQRLAGALDALINMKPIYNTLIKTLEKEKIKIKFQIGVTQKDNNGNWIPAMYNSDRSITFKDINSILPENLEEGLIMAVRSIEYGNNLDITIMNYDLEVKYFRDIVNSRMGDHTSYFAYSFLQSNYQSEYVSFINIFSSRSLKETDLTKFNYFSEHCNLKNAKIQNNFSNLLLKKYLIGY